jgi:hypothetical protein
LEPVLSTMFFIVGVIGSSNVLESCLSDLKKQFFPKLIAVVCQSYGVSDKLRNCLKNQARTLDKIRERV